MTLETPSKAEPLSNGIMRVARPRRQSGGDGAYCCLRSVCYWFSRSSWWWLDSSLQRRPRSCRSRSGR